jgi:hypothetical protein
MLYSELGRLPLIVSRKLRIIKYWLRLLETDNCILQALYAEMYEMSNTATNPRMWLYEVKNLLCSLGFADLWLSQYVNNIPLFIKVAEERLTDQFIQERDSYLSISPKCIIYKHLIDTFSLQYYLTKSLPLMYIRLITKFRLSAHKLSIESGRYSNTPRHNRLCNICGSVDVEDEFHFILKCPAYISQRKSFIKKYYFNKPSVFKLVQLLSVQNVKELINLRKYLYQAIEIRNNLS